MKKILNNQKVSRLATVFAALFLSACAGSSGGGGNSDGGNAPAGGGDAVQTAGYYEELLAKPVGDCAHVEDLQFQALANLQSDKFGSTADRKDMVVHILLSLKSDGKYTAVYSEEKIISENANGVTYENLFSKNIEGAWTLENETKLNLVGLGVANKLQIGNEKKVYLKIQERIHDPRVNSLQIVLAKTLTAISPEGETAEQFCGL